MGKSKHICSPLYDDDVRKEQSLRMKSLNRQVCDKAAVSLHAEAERFWRAIPEDLRERIYLPSVRIFSEVLGILRTAATLKTNPMLRLELSVKEIASLIRRSESAVKAVFRWLVSGPIHLDGEIVARGLGIIATTHRVGLARLDGVFCKVHRTAIRFFTAAGKAILAIGYSKSKSTSASENGSGSAPRRVKVSKVPSSQTSSDAPAAMLLPPSRHSPVAITLQPADAPPQPIVDDIVPPVGVVGPLAMRLALEETLRLLRSTA